MNQSRKFQPLFGDKSVQKVANFLGCHRTSFKIANWFWTYVYYVLTPEERAKLEQLNPVLPTGCRKETIHQWLEENLAEDRKHHFCKIEELIDLSTSESEFKELFRRKFHKAYQTTLF